MKAVEFGLDTENWYLFQPTSDGGFIVYGNFLNADGGTQKDIVKLDSAGNIVTAFNVETGFVNNNPFGAQLTYEDGSGNVWVIGNFDGYKGVTFGALVVLDSTGTSIIAGADTFTGTNPDLYVIAPSFDGDSVFIGGVFNEYDSVTAPNNFIKIDIATKARIALAGQEAFDGAVFGIVNYNNTTFPDYTLIVSGYFNNYGATPCWNVVHLYSDGSLVNPEFGNFTKTGGGAVGYLKYDAFHNSILVFGDFDSYQDLGETRAVGNFISIHPEIGQMDSYYENFDGEVYDVQLTADNNYFITGAFTHYGSTESTNSIIISRLGAVVKTFATEGSFYMLGGDRIVGVTLDNVLIELQNDIPVNTKSLTFDKVTKKAEYTSGGFESLTDNEIVNKRNVSQAVSQANATLNEFSEAKVRATILTGLSLATNAVISATDSVLSAFGKLQKQITDGFTSANIKSILGITTLSGSNTGDEDTASIKSKLGITTLSGSNTGDQDLSSYATKTGTETLTNKRVTKRVYSTTGSGTINVNSDNYDIVKVTGINNTITLANPTGTPTERQALLYDLTDDNSGTKSILYGSEFANLSISAPTATVSGRPMIMIFLRNTSTSKWEFGGWA